MVGLLVFQKYMETRQILFGILCTLSTPPLTKEMRMTKTAGILMVSLFVSGLCVAPFAMAASAQQNKMKTCSAEAKAKGLGEGKGDERRAFMKECLSAKPIKAAGEPQQSNQQSKMKSCNKEAGAKGLTGDDRKEFMSTCLSS